MSDSPDAPVVPGAAHTNRPGEPGEPDSSSSADSPGQDGPPADENNAPDEAPASGKFPPANEPLAVVRFGRTHQVGLFRHNLEPPPRRGSAVVVRTQRGVELGEVVSVIAEGCPVAHPGCLGRERLCAMMREQGSPFVYNRQCRVLRPASPQDINDQMHLDRAGREKISFCRQQGEELGLKMRPVCVEHLFGGERVIFYFTSETRIDFRELVRRLAGQYRTRIEMRQIGARDEARLVGDYERCGQRCCCQQFLGELQPVSIRMAKTQKATLDPTKISGRCGRLMCCLRYEDETYEVLRRKLPKKNTWVRTADLVGRVVSASILTQLVKVVDAKGTLTAIENDSILERNLPAPADAMSPGAAEDAHFGRMATNRPATPAWTKASSEAEVHSEEDGLVVEPQEDSPAAPGQGETAVARPDSEVSPPRDETAGPRSRRRRRRRGKSQAVRGQPEGLPRPADQAAPQPGGPKRRRRGWRKRGRAGGKPGPGTAGGTGPA